MKRVIVSRHPAAIDFIRSADPRFARAPVLGSATAADVRGAIVAGNLPLHLAARARAVVAVEFRGMPPRGTEYGLAEMRASGAVLRTYVVRQVDGTFRKYRAGVPERSLDNAPRRSFDKKALMREIDSDQKRAARAKLAAFKANVTKVRKAWPKDRARAKAFCGRQKVSAKIQIARLRAAMRVRVKARAAALKAAARTRCTLNRSMHRSKLDHARQTYREEQRYQASLRRTENANKKRLRPRSLMHERQSESDDQVRQNIPADLIPLFERVKRQIKGTERATRTEAFLEYVESHPREQYEAIEDEVDRMIAERERKERGE